MRFTNVLYKLLSGCLSMLGFSGCILPCEYGPPPVEYNDYMVKGIVTDTKGNSLKGIEVKVIDSRSNKDVTIYTDSDGYFKSPMIQTPSLGNQMLHFTDIDGEANGGEFSKKTISIKQMEEYKNDDEYLYVAKVSLQPK